MSRVCGLTVFVQATAAAVVAANQQNPAYVIPLRGIAIGNGLIDPLLTTQSYPAYAYAKGLIDSDCLQQANSLFPACQVFHLVCRFFVDLFLPFCSLLFVSFSPTLSLETTLRPLWTATRCFLKCSNALGKTS